MKILSLNFNNRQWEATKDYSPVEDSFTANFLLKSPIFPFTTVISLPSLKSVFGNAFLCFNPILSESHSIQQVTHMLISKLTAAAWVEKINSDLDANVYPLNR